ncbi:MAG: exodeoxyribonuclease VII small subunit [Stenotrophobium sp.]
MSTNKDPVSQFEDAMKELEAIVQKMERGDLRLEESLKVFERGIALAQQCRKSLETAELKVKTLMAKTGDLDTPTA